MKLFLCARQLYLNSIGFNYMTLNQLTVLGLKDAM